MSPKQLHREGQTPVTPPRPSHDHDHGHHGHHSPEGNAERSRRTAGQAQPSPGQDEDFPWLGTAVGAGLGGLLMGVPGAVLGGMFGQEIEDGIDSMLGNEEEGLGGNLGLGTEVDALVARSPTLTASLAQAQENGWTITTGEPGGGTFASPSTKTITIDPDTTGDVPGVVQSLAHEVGHALDETERYVGPDGLTRDQYVDQNTTGQLEGEAEATIMNLRVREELLAGDDGVDIGVAGAGSAEYQRLYAQYQEDGDREALVRGISTHFAHNEHPSNDPDSDYHDYYSRFYENHWDEHVAE